MSAGADKVVVTAALNGALTDPTKFNVPVTPAEMAQAAQEAWDAGATIAHIHFRDQRPGLGHLPTWDPDVAADIVDAIRSMAPGVLINCSTGVVGSDISGPAAVMRRVHPEIAAMNSGSLNYLRARSNGQWAWPPMLFDNPVSKIQAFLEVMNEVGAVPEFECFDLGIVRSVGLFEKAGRIMQAN